MRDDLFQMLYSLGDGLFRYGIYGEGIKCFEEALALITLNPPDPHELGKTFSSILSTLTAFYVGSGQMTKFEKNIEKNIIVQQSPNLSGWVPKIKEMELDRLACLELRKKDAFKSLVGVSKEWSDILNKIERLAKSSKPVLITGPSGVGKELIAQAIHSESERKPKPFVAVNCTAIPDGLIPSELFGSERGAYTGAERRIGLCELAKEGTFLLDEIGKSSQIFQQILLRFIQEKEFMRVGGRESIKFKARIIATTNKDIPALIKENLFLEDLYFRLNVHEILVPPLAQRPSDIEELIFYFLTTLDKKRRMSIEAVDAIKTFYEQRDIHRRLGEYLFRTTSDKKEAIRVARAMGADLNSYEENNVRELENYITRLVEELDDEALTTQNLAMPRWDPSFISAFYRVPAWVAGKGCAKKDIEKALILAKGNQSKVARLFRCSPQTIDQKVTKFDLSAGRES
ncbi:MAG: sigma 54-interacting transcriptional regulator [Dissulfurispiraceae bacterium]